MINFMYGILTCMVPTALAATRYLATSMAGNLCLAALRLHPSGISDSIIQSGQAFFVHATSSGTAKRVYDVAPANIVFTEDAKVNEGGAVNFTRKAENIPPTQLQALSASLFTGTDKSDGIADGNVAVFGETYSDKFDRNDALKIANSGENFGLKAGDKLLSIEA